MATAIERKFTGLRKRLDQLGYRQALGIESLPLVERLFNDLLHTTESLRNAKLQITRSKEQKGLWEKHVEPYQQDNSRLTQENVALHQQILALKESLEQRTKELKVCMRRLEHENADLKFLNNQYMQRIISQEKESQLKSERILELQEKNSQAAIIQTPGGRKKTLPYRRQRMEMDSVLTPSSSKGKLLPVLPEPDPQVVDLLKMAEEKMIEMQRSLDSIGKEKKEMKDSIKDLRRQVERRENEIERLSGQLRGGRPPEALAMEGKIESNERMTAHLNIQVDFLQQANQKLEADLAEANESKTKLQARVNDLAGKNAKICSELQEISEMVKEMEREREESESLLQTQIKDLQERRNEGEKQLIQMERELMKNKESYQELLSDNKKMAEILSSSQADCNRAASLIERLTNENNQLRKQARLAKEPGLDQYGSMYGDVGKERDQLRETLRKLELDLKQSQDQAKALAQDRDNTQLLYRQVCEELSRFKSPTATKTSGPHPPLTHPPTSSPLPPPPLPSSPLPPSLTHHVSRLEGERDDARTEVRELRSECQSLREKLSMIREEKGEVEKDRNREEVRHLQTQLEELSKERDKLKLKSESLRETISGLEKEVIESTSALSSAKSDNRQLNGKIKRLQGLLEASENARKEDHTGLQHQISETEIIIIESNKLKSRLSQLEGEVEKKQDKMEELTQSLKALDREHDLLRRECDSKDEEISKLKNEMQQKDSKNEHYEGHMTRFKAFEFEAQNVLATKEKELALLRQQLSHCEEEKERREGENASLSQSLKQLKDDLATMTMENQRVNEELRRVSSEREKLTVQAKEQQETLVKYQEELSVKDQERVQLLESYQSLAKEAERLELTIQQAKSQHSSLDIEISSLQQENNQLRELCQQHTSEISQHLATLESYELQMSSLTSSLAKMEEMCRQEQNEKQALMGDLAAVRELCVQLDKTKDSLTRQLASVSAVDEQTHSEMNDLLAERDLLKQQYNNERTRVQNLEVLLSNERKKEFKAHLANEERETEINHLRQQLTRLENENVAQRDQIKSLCSDLTIKQEELNRLTSKQSTLSLQKQETENQLSRLRTVISASSTLSPKQSSHEITHSVSASSKSQPTGVEEAISREEEELRVESAKLIRELLSQSMEKTNTN
ncbi:PREDICTED: centrosomal protein of 135 kDa-like isoform X2 [Amphimedon queenslandica]|uniref:Centrosomal protein of 135 kDa n=1 Tax=Amphimedon queenslandica TaxID=400682 RepID=A0AAN0JDT3_AMPQE|nr:PREDICTED: centrosomal protein of 135 kDa-like isoform X2 [Amphimedon queenslandica]|eukprot:XP_019854907.1 PREDICTED: centrosomal protein of 135 kDa-like isoform X2 [Amphimedon queenslandica]